MTEVVAALVFNKDGRFMICQRPENKKRGLLWEFVGGKVEKNSKGEYIETKEEALKRECREELDIDIKVGKVFMSTIHEYPDITINLTVFLCDLGEKKPTLLEHNDLKWILPSEIPLYEFCPADKDILEKIKTDMTDFSR